MNFNDTIIKDFICCYSDHIMDSVSTNSDRSFSIACLVKAIDTMDSLILNHIEKYELEGSIWCEYIEVRDLVVNNLHEFHSYIIPSIHDPNLSLDEIKSIIEEEKYAFYGFIKVKAKDMSLL